MKTLVLALTAASMLAAPLAQAAPAVSAPRTQTVDVVKVAGPHGHRYERHVVKRKVVKKTRWVRGHRVPVMERKVVVRDYHRYGLNRPARGQEWVRVGNDYLLIGITSGIIAGIIAGR